MKRSAARSRPQKRSRAVGVETRALVLLRDGEACLRCDRRATQIHHRRPRGMGGTRDPRINDPRNLVVLCGSGTEGCHGWVESHRDRARELGWLITSLDDEELGRPIIIAGGELAIYLKEDGTSVVMRVRVGSAVPPRTKEAP